VTVYTWKTIPSHPNCEVSSRGAVRYKDSKENRAIGLNNQGYPQVTINGKKEFCHRLVMEAFVGPRPDGMVIDHTNSDKIDNSVGNLRYVTWSENNKETGRNTRFYSGELWLMEKLLRAGVPQWKIARMFRCSQGIISYHFKILGLPNRRSRSLL